MFSANGEGKILPPYVVYKAQHLYESWKEGGPKNHDITELKAVGLIANPLYPKFPRLLKNLWILFLKKTLNLGLKNAAFCHWIVRKS